MYLVYKRFLISFAKGRLRTLEKCYINMDKSYIIHRLEHNGIIALRNPEALRNPDIDSDLPAVLAESH